MRHAFYASLVDTICSRCGNLESFEDHKVFTPVARTTDPETSWEAARSVTGIRETQAEILRLLKERGPMTDEEVIAHYHGRQSVSGIRTRRHELVDAGLVKAAGKRKGQTGRAMTVWAAA
jgi:predicted HTH transcriptional regulator